MYPARPSSTRPSIEHHGSSVSTGITDGVAEMDFGGETVSTLQAVWAVPSWGRLRNGGRLLREVTDTQVESLMQKLAIERRVQYGAEKMLDVSSPVYGTS
jgi:hypothetical protein